MRLKELSCLFRVAILLLSAAPRVVRCVVRVCCVD